MAQTDSASIRVLVEDPSKAPVSGASVKLSNQANGTEATGLTNADGYVVFSPVLRGTYTIDASLTGFKTVRLTDIIVNVDERRLIRVGLEVSQVSTTVEVQADVSSVQTEQGSLGQVIGGKAAVELPLAGRRYTELALLAPGVTASTLNPVTRGPGWFVSNGNYHTQNNFLLDGIDNNQGTQNAQALSAQVVQPSPDSIAEFKVQTNSFSAEFGRSAGAVVNVSIKSGGNDVHGSAWYFNRNEALAATPWGTNLIGGQKPNLRWNQFGGTVGGPIVQNKLFYFGAYEGFRQTFSDPYLNTVPTADQRQGIFAFNVLDPASGQNFPGNRVPVSRFDPLGKKLMDLYPAANLPGRTTSGRPVDNYGVNLPGIENTHKFDVRSDYLASSRDSLMVRFSYLRQDINRDPIFPGIADGVGNQGAQFNDNQSLGFTWNRTISPSVVNTFRYGLNRTFATFAHATVDGEKADAFGFRGIPSELLQVGGLPLIDVNNYNDLGTRNFRPQFQRPWLNQFLNIVSVQTGRHFLRMGAEVRLKDNAFVDVTRRTPAYSLPGRYTGDSMPDLLLGLPEAVQVNTVPEVKQLQQAISGFIQDDWKIAPTFTLNLGVRYEYTTPFYGSGQNRNINFNPSTGGLVFASDNDKYLVRQDWNNIGPRVGFAWQLLPERFVLRGGYGVFFNSEDTYGSEANLPLNPPQLTQATLLRQGTGPAPLRLSDPIPNDILSRFDPRTVTLRTREFNQSSGTVQQWNLAMQIKTSRASTFEIAYVGNRGRNLFALWDRNQTPFGIDGSIPANRPFPQWQQIQTGASVGRSWYNAVQAKWEHNFSRGLFALASYTFASALDEAGTWDAGSSPQIGRNFEAERGPQSQTPRQRFTYAGIYEIPIGRGRAVGNSMPRALDFVIGGWQLSGILTWRGGLPLNVSLNGNGVDPVTGQRYLFLNRNGGALRPDRIREGNTNIDPKANRLRFLDPGAFAVQAINTPGNSSRNNVVGPNLFTLDGSLVKRFAITERQALDLRLEAFNALNTVNFGNPATTFGNVNFGQINSAGLPRIVQVAIRYAF
jgi:hypothetical protein